MKSIKCIISGKVQGVGFRWSTKRKANSLNIKGHAKNLPNGTVEVIAFGEDGNLDELKRWFEEEGPRLSRIDDIECKSIKLDKKPTTFRTL